MKQIQRVSTPTADSIVEVKPKLRHTIAEDGMLIILCIAVTIGAVLANLSTLKLSLFGSGIILLLYLVYVLFRIKLTSWTITSNQLIYKRGVVAIKTDYMELYRINDFSEEQSVIERLLGIKRIIIHSTDKSNERLVMFGILQQIDIVYWIRRYVEQSKRNRNIYEIANY